MSIPVARVFSRYSCSGPLCDLPIPGGCQVDGSREYSPLIKAMQCLLDKKRGNAPPVVLDDPLLDDIGLFRCGLEVMNSAHQQDFPKDAARCPAETRRPVLHVWNPSAVAAE
jgi:hypothetical protein